MNRAGIIGVGLAIFLSAGIAVAGHHGGPRHGGPDPDRMAAHMADKLGLDDEQRAAVHTVMEKRRDEMRELHDQLRANHREMRALDPEAPDYEARSKALAERQGELTTQMAMARSQLHADIMANLNEEQQAQLTEMREQRMEKRREHHKEQRGKPPEEEGVL